MSDKVNVPHTSPFDAIRKVDEQGREHWSARTMSKLLGYTEYSKFKNAIQKAEKACEGSNEAVSDHFAHVSDMIQTGKGAKRSVDDVRLSRYACYLIVQNADPAKPIVALGQTYFAVQTRRQELTDQLAQLPEDQKRLIYRSEMAIFNQQLAEAAKNAGVIQPLDFATFQDHGYMGLYGGLRENDVHVRKHLEPKDKILDYMGSEELASNIFRAAQTEAQIRRENIQEKEKANQAHHTMGKRVREFIKEGGGTMPEDLPTPEKSIQQLQKEEQKRVERQQQPELPLFTESDGQS
jgi:DNA-damage-inducible protein D